MGKRPASWFRNVAVLGTVVAVLMVPLMELVMHAHLSLWLHIPLTAVILTLMSAGAAAAGVAYLEYQARTTQA